MSKSRMTGGREGFGLVLFCSFILQSGLKAIVSGK